MRKCLEDNLGAMLKVAPEDLLEDPPGEKEGRNDAKTGSIRNRGSLGSEKGRFKRTGQCPAVRDRALGPLFFRMLGQTHVNGWSRVVASQNGGSTDYISPLRLGVLQWSRHLFNYWKNKKTIIEKFLILLI